MPAKACPFRAMMDTTGENLFTKMKGTQLPAVSDWATAGHKLQGSTAVKLHLNKWRCAQNWAHMMLSHSKEMRGLGCVEDCQI